MKHKLYEMIVAKAENMDLVVLLKNSQGWSIKENQFDIQFHEMFEYFLCLPQHKEACLHWLNGGVSLDVKNESGNWSDYSLVNVGKPWSKDRDFMREEYYFRIKPKKEKRWIGVFRDGDLIKNTELSYRTKEQVVGDSHAPYGFDDWQFIEIEVEV